MADNKKHNDVVGGGFAGINFIKSLGKSSAYKVTLVDINNYNFFTPLIYQSSTTFIEVSNIIMHFCNLFKKYNVISVHMGKLLNIQPERNLIETDTGELLYDYLVLATGTETNFFGMENVKKHAFPMKNITDALAIRNKLLLNLEDYIQRKDDPNREAYINIV